MKRNYYKEIMDILSVNPLGEAHRNTPVAFFKACQKYDWYHTMYENISSNAGKVLQNYIEEDSCLAKRRLKKNREQNQKLNRAEKTRLDIEEKLYVEFFTEIYSEYYRADYKWNKVVDCEEKVAEILEDYFHGTHPDCVKSIKKAVMKAYQSSYRKVDLGNLHNAMRIVEESLHMPMPKIESSIEKVISGEMLESMLFHLERGNTAQFIFHIAPMARALTVGAYHKYTPNNNNVFFNVACDYNLKQLESYIRGGEDEEGYPVEGLEGLLERYSQTRNELLELRGE